MLSRWQEKVGSKISSFCIVPVNTIRDVTFPSGETPLMYFIFSMKQGVMPLRLKGCFSEERSGGRRHLTGSSRLENQSILAKKPQKTEYRFPWQKIIFLSRSIISSGNRDPFATRGSLKFFQEYLPSHPRLFVSSCWWERAADPWEAWWDCSGMMLGVVGPEGGSHQNPSCHFSETLHMSPVGAVVGEELR